MKVLSIVDSFKGTLSSVEISEIIKEELATRNISVTSIPISDGGEGFLDAYNFENHYDKVYVKTVDPFMKEIEAYYLFDKENNYAVIEMAKSSGITLVKELNPFKASTYGLGLVIKDAIEKGAKEIIMGIGGSCSNDGGVGMLNALGAKFYDEDDNRFDALSNMDLPLINRIDLQEFKELTGKNKFVICSDVTNPLLGPNGATYIFSPQKGAKVEDLPVLEANMEHFSEFGEGKTLAGSGAAGGVGFAFRAFFNSFFYSGISYLLEKIDYNSLIRDYDYIITGEGKVDNQSLKGKVISEIIRRSVSKRVILICGINELDVSLGTNVRVVSVVGNSFTKEESMKNPKETLRQTIRRLIL